MLEKCLKVVILIAASMIGWAAYQEYFADRPTEWFPPDAEVEPEVETSEQVWFPQKCDMCGSDWEVSNYKTPGDPVPPTVEWCFHDGQFCEVGLGVVIEITKNGNSPKTERKMLNHCLTCTGCRCATFSPDEWHEVIDVIKEIRSREKTDEP